MKRGIYNTIESTPHPFTQYTIFDIGNTIHLINDILLFNKQKYILSPFSNYIESGIICILIIGKGIRIIKGITIHLDSKSNGDLILNNIIYIFGFHVNIILKTKLRKAGL